MPRVLLAEVLVCPSCRGRRRALAAILVADSIRRILLRLSLPPDTAEATLQLPRSGRADLLTGVPPGGTSCPRGRGEAACPHRRSAPVEAPQQHPQVCGETPPPQFHLPAQGQPRPTSLNWVSAWPPQLPIA